MFAPLEILEGNSICDYEIENYVNLNKLVLSKVQNNWEKVKNSRTQKKSLIKNFVKKRDCLCDHDNPPKGWQESFGRSSIVVQNENCIFLDLTFNNPIYRSLDPNKDD